ncbi:Rab7L3, Rab7-like protein [Monocercomonoides exilis]|uniref:Rab7L3, Rab7-like protein n=1 Tax=Monocercomonoides exilis TaxID=2049356 RepID=UPI00355ACC1A|nr:Rab7L3, Rab7-like protein [Monocercomonoides exilis]|eukprot:MONOS_4144.1-p1 / transcript=MONOS_4144.1 / gene=MONOS_4144 / organism=Monocercomonoides_exilis_PA203 / gene_product=Rab7L3, Rab7-like protein / transcript_product=Rab7L3, Rab7-like protein / location=Mono_scaffold00106:65656-66249(-) / protein_length=198 / sequence_SO=supercontig / SO=protein_coding / is_pseudo=false
MNEAEEESRVKVNLIGEFGTGKTSLTQRYVDGYSHDYKSRIGIDFKAKNVIVEGKEIRVLIWEERLPAIYEMENLSYFRGSDACAFVFNLTSHDSFDCLKNKKEKVENVIADDLNDYPFILIGNKNDQHELRDINRFEVENWCQKEGIRSYFETSAETGDKVDEAFSELVRLALIHHKSYDFKMKELAAKEPFDESE